MNEKETIVCRCEDITHAEIEKAIDEGYTTLEEIKRHLKCCIGPCQGRTCIRLIAGIISRKTGKHIDQLEFPTSRPPARPVPLFILTGDKDGDKD